ncbi:MAG: toll/interleukin-1 receptor domain-containing protein [Myxococcota bacterium]
MRKLEEFLMSAFSDNELRRFIRYLPEGDQMLNRLPANGVSLSEFTSAFVELAQRDGIIDDKFFAALMAERPRRRDAIEWLQRQQFPQASTSPAQTPLPVASSSEHYDIFIIHSSLDKPWVEQLYAALTAKGLNVFFDRASVRPGDRWDKTIPAALAASAACVVVVSQNVDQGFYAQSEIQQAIAQHRQHDMVVIPVHLGGLQSHPPYGLNMFQAIDVDRIGGHLPTADEVWRRVAGDNRTP